MKTHLPLYHVALLAGIIFLLSAGMAFLLQTALSLARALGSTAPIFHQY
jgi:hypothetical protein